MYCVKGDGSKKIHARRVGDGHNQSKQEGMPRRAFRSHQVSRDDGFAVSRFQRMQRAKPSSDEGRKECDTKSYVLRGDELRERVARSLLTIGRDVDAGLPRSGAAVSATLLCAAATAALPAFFGE